MKLQYSLLCLCALLISASCAEEPTVLGPRGPRPNEPGFKADKCATEKEWPVCLDDEWGRKCPSGCRIQGLLDQTDHEILNKIEKIRKLLDEGKKLHRSTDLESKNTYNFLRERLVSSAGNDNRYTTLAEQLRQRIVELKIKIDRQLRVLEALKAQIKTQFISVQRLEVDIDIKLRSCKGSCASSVNFSVDKEGYESLEKQLDRLDTLKVQTVETVSSLKVLKSRPLKDVNVPSIYKSITSDTERAAQRKTYFSDVGQLQLSLEAEGSTAETAATVSKVSTGTGQSTPISTTRITSQSLSCTQTVRKVTTVTKDGVQEKYETVRSGPGCDTIGKLGLSEAELLSAAKDGKELTADGFTVKVTGGDSKSITTLNRGDGELGGLGGDFFKGLGSSGQDRKLSSSFTSSSSSSSSSSKTIISGGSKGFHSDTKSITSTSSPDYGDDLGGFLRGDIEDDLPDLHARSLKSRDDRKADFIGGDCVEIQQKHTAGDQSGLFKVKPAGSEEVVELYCDQATGLGGWVLIQQREDGSVNFNRTWDEYRVGFGKIDKQGRGEIWIGNHILHLLTQKESVLRVELLDWAGNEAYAEYNVQVGSETEGFQLNVSSYTGDAGDALVQGLANTGSFLSHAGMKFSTFDRDNDKWEESCAKIYGGGWWYNNCQSANLNGIYYKGGKYDRASKIPYEVENGVVWLPYKPADYSLKVVRMKIRPL
ncbi:fibrinogen alpha chain [Ictalurus punctatus]|uniref:Fibrinogen alpha chain n=1 Tax=Ictalurus punctatus TaxID=7998 RepID=A0A2D0Q534_ICTPU|nr:fibrinogen alpha chain [Ictalurus punctatus]